MRNFVQTAVLITVAAAPYVVASGGGCLVGALFGVAQAAAANGAQVVLETQGVFDLPKAAGDTPAVGAKVYWNDAAKSVTTTAAGNTLIGCAIKAALAGDATVRVRLNGTV